MKKIFSAIMLFQFIMQWCVAQQSPPDTLLKRFDGHRRQVIQEKIYAHLDRDYYLTGETLWFKIYSVDGSFHKPLDLSKVAYVEILDRANFPVLQAKIKLQKGTGNGSFFLPASLGSGYYRFRAYTNWMKNSGPEFYYDHVLTIVNPFVAPGSTASKAVPTTHSLSFFPEGGNLVSGIQSKVAFSLTDESGRGIIRKCHVLDDRGDTIVTFTPERFGLGHFFIKPSPARRYHAVVESGPREKKAFPLPEIHHAGYTLQLLDSGEFVRVVVRGIDVDQQHIFLFVHARQIIAHAERQTLQGNHTFFEIAKNALPDGISHFTLFNDNLQPACERLYFTYPRKNLDIDIRTNQKISGTRKKLTVSIHAKKNAITAAAEANLSMSVYKLDSLASPESAGIFPYFWLRSDLTGTVESPEYYFQDRTPEVVRAMDNLMLTHGWRRFDWNDILAGYEPPTLAYLPEVREHIISATISSDRDISRGVFTYLGSPGKIVRAYGAWSNPQGEVRFEIKDFYGPRRIILQTRTDTTETYTIKIRDPFSAMTDTEKIPAFSLRADQKEELLSRSIAMQVQDVYYYETSGNIFVPPIVDSVAFYGKADATYYLDDYTRFPLMEEVMREYVPGVFVRKRRDGFHFLVVDEARKGILDGDPMVLLDGVPVLDVDDIMRINPLRVKKLEVVKRPYYLGQAMFSGIVSYTTYLGDLGGLELDPRSVSLNYEGLQMERRFHKPAYTRGQIDDRMPDQRYLLHWEPDIKTDPEGKHQSEFYTSDVPGQYIVIVQGLDNEGNSGTGTLVFTVNPSDSQ